MSRRDRERERDRDRDRGRERYERDSGTRRYRSGFDREPSPKRSRRDEKQETEELRSKPNPESGALTHHSEKDHLKPQESVVPPGPASGPDSKLESADDKKEPERKPNEHQADGTPSTDPTEVPRSRNYFQHDDRRSAGQVGRGFVRRATTEERGWRDSKDDRSERATNRSTTNDRDQKEGGAKDDNSTWRHDGFFKIEDEARPPPARRQRPAFREKKTPSGSDNVPAGPMRSGQIDRRPVSGGEERDRHVVDRSERAAAEGGHRRGRPLSRERPGGIRSNNYSKGRERFNARQSSYPNQGGGTRVEKWKHDLFEEAAAKSPSSKNDDDHIARVEALLAS